VSSVLNRLIAANEQLAARVRHLEAAEVPVLGSDSLTIASGEITLTSKAPIIRVWLDTESAAASDDLDTINGGALHTIVILTTTNNTRDVTVKDVTGNIQSAGDFALNTIADTIVLMKHSTTATFKWLELARSNNG